MMGVTMKLLALGITSALLLSGVAAAQEQLPQQLLPTGEEDAPARAEAFAAHAAQESRQSAEQRLRAMVDDSPEGLETVHKPDGTVGVNIAGRFMHVMVATPTEDGRYVSSCHTGEEALSHVHRAQEMSAGKLPKLKAAAPVVIVDRQPVLEEK
jgi:hypothetical protein